MSPEKHELDPLDRPIKAAKAFADVLGWPLKQVEYQLQRGQIDADKLGKRRWVSTARRLLRQFAGGAPA
jgi:hypothetical protein